MTPAESREEQSEAPQWERKEVKAKHIRKEGLTGLGKVQKKKKKIKENLELSDQDSNSKKTVQRTALLSNPNFRARKT